MRQFKNAKINYFSVYLQLTMLLSLVLEAIKL